MSLPCTEVGMYPLRAVALVAVAAVEAEEVEAVPQSQIQLLVPTSVASQPSDVFPVLSMKNVFKVRVRSGRKER